MTMTKLKTLPPIDVQHCPAITRRHAVSMWEEHLSALHAKRDSEYVLVMPDIDSARSLRNALDDYIRRHQADMYGCKGRLNKQTDGTYAVRITWPTPHIFPTAEAMNKVVEAIARPKKTMGVQTRMAG